MQIHNSVHINVFPRQNTRLNSSLVSIVLKIPNLAPSLGPNIFMWPFSQWLNLSTESNKILLSSQEVNGRRAKYMSNRGERNDRTQSRRVNTQQAHLELGVWLGGRRGSARASQWTDAVAPRPLTCLLLRWDPAARPKGETGGGEGSGFVGNGACYCVYLGYLTLLRRRMTPFWVFALPTYPTPSAHKHDTQTHKTLDTVKDGVADTHSPQRAHTHTHIKTCITYNAYMLLWKCWDRGHM